MGDWLEHDGKSCPVPPGTMVEAVFMTVVVKDRVPEGDPSPCWLWADGYEPIRLYRVVPE